MPELRWQINDISNCWYWKSFWPRWEKWRSRKHERSRRRLMMEWCLPMMVTTNSVKQKIVVSELLQYLIGGVPLSLKKSVVSLIEEMEDTFRRVTHARVAVKEEGTSESERGGKVEDREDAHGGNSSVLKEVEVHVLHAEEVGKLQSGEV